MLDWFTGDDWPTHIGLVVGILFILINAIATMHVLNPWEEAVILRIGRFSRVRGNGFFLTLPWIEDIAKTVDKRTTTWSFTSNNTLTSDTVSVSVEAVLFYKVIDTQKAVLTVENYENAIELAATTALREAISQNLLDTLLTKRDDIDAHIATSIAAQATAWGIEVGSVQIRDIQLPQDLTDSMSRQSQATREKQARETLASAELEVAKQCAAAAAIYDANPTALHLRGMNMLYEGMKEKGALIVVPSSAVDSMNLGTLAAAAHNGAPVA